MVCCKTVYYYKDENVYEERIVIHRAVNFEEAWKKNEKEVSDYIKNQFKAVFQLNALRL
jgi:hypothetical protein